MRDTAADVAAELGTRRARTLLVAAAVALSTAALVAAGGLATSAAAEVDAAIASASLDQVTLSMAAEPDQDRGPTDDSVVTWPSDAADRATRLPLVTSAGFMIDTSGLTCLRVSRLGPASPAVHVALVGASRGYLDAARLISSHDSSWLLDSDAHVAILGDEAARRLDVPQVADPTGYQVWVGSTPYSVVGFFSSSSETTSSTVVIPYRSAVGLVGSDARSTLLVGTAPGAGRAVGRVIREQVLPDAPSRLATSQVVTLDEVRHDVGRQLATFTAAVGAFLTVLTALLVSGSMIGSVAARTGEIGLRRALGSSRRTIGLLFLCEGLLVGLIGGTAGSAIATWLVTAVAAANDWPVRESLVTVLMGPLIGGTIGLVASAVPAARAARLDPALAVRMS